MPVAYDYEAEYKADMRSGDEGAKRIIVATDVEDAIVKLRKALAEAAELHNTRSASLQKKAFASLHVFSMTRLHDVDIL